MSFLDTQLRAELLERTERDQRARKGGDVDAMQRVDANNLAFLRPIIERRGWLNSALVGTDGAHACWLLVQHSPPAERDRWLPLLRNAVRQGLAARRDLAYLQDRVDADHGRRQRYGTQSFGLGSQPARLWPLHDPATVDAVRDAQGLPRLDADGVATAWRPDELAHLGIAVGPPG